MVKQGGSTALILVATGLLMFMAGCETSKHAEIMGDESLAAKKRAEQMKAAEASGIPLGDQGMSQSSISGFAPEGPPGATLRGLDRGTDMTDSLPTMANGAEMPSGVSTEIPEPASPGEPPVFEGFPEGNRGPAAGFGPVDPALPSFREPPQAMESESAPVAAVETPKSAFEPGPTGYEDRDLKAPTSPSSGFMPGAPPLPTLGQETFEASETPDTVVAVPDVMDASKPSMEPVAEQPEPVMETVQPESVDTGATAPPLMEIADVFFDFDKYAIRSDAAATLVQNARILQNEHRGKNILIEGHCDERGTEEYNMVLGERRAQAVKNYLVDLGVSASTIQIVSYGKERPFCTEHYDACWDQNRRGHFVIQ